MQTFLPYPDFEKSARCLDRQRLGKQRLEVFYLLQVLSGEKQGYKFHPCTKMWRGHETALVRYGWYICEEWKKRKYKDTMQYKILNTLGNKNIDDFVYPPWFGDEKFHLSHKSNLIRKFPEHYKKFWPEVPNDLKYIWPV